MHCTYKIPKHCTHFIQGDFRFLIAREDQIDRENLIDQSCKTLRGDYTLFQISLGVLALDFQQEDRFVLLHTLAC